MRAALARNGWLAVGAAEAAVVLGDRFLEARGHLRRRLRADGSAVRALILGELELELIRQIHELLEFALDQVRVARDAAAQRLAELADGAQLFFAQALRLQLISEREQLARRVVELLLHLIDALGVVPQAAVARIPDAAA